MITEKINRYLLIGVIGAVLLYFFSQSENKTYKDWYSGYEAGWNGEEVKFSLWDSKEKKEGYEQGIDNADAYDEGYYDAKEGNEPKYLKDTFYMDGYKDGKKTRY